MAASTQTAPDAYLQSGSSPPTKADLKHGWETYRRNAEPHGLAFGKLCYDFRIHSEVVQGGTSFTQTLADLNIPRRTAYYWITRHEELIGVRQPALEPEPAEEVSVPPEGTHRPEPATVADIRVDDANDPPMLQDAKPRLVHPAIVELKKGMNIEINGRVFKLNSPIEDAEIENDLERQGKQDFTVILHVTLSGGKVTIQ